MPATGRSPEMQFIPTRDALLGEGMTIRRALPSAQCRMIGAWCFLDHFGPVDATRGDGLRVGPHPHNSLQTFWAGGCDARRRIARRPAPA